MQSVETIFYDGHCGLCHGFVRFVVRRDRSARFEFAPLFGEYFAGRVPAEKQSGLPDSVVVLDATGELRVKSAAALHVLAQLGGGWRTLAAVAGIVPSPLRDFLYDFVARVRKKLFAPPLDACPLLPPELRKRFRH